MLPRPPCILHAIALPYVNGHKASGWSSSTIQERIRQRSMQLDSYLKNLEYFGDKDWDTTRLIMIGLGYVRLPKWDKDVQIVHNILALDHPARQSIRDRLRSRHKSRSLSCHVRVRRCERLKPTGGYSITWLARAQKSTTSLTLCTASNKPLK